MAREEIKVVIASEYDDKGADEAIRDAALVDKLSPTVDIDADTSKLDGAVDAIDNRLGGALSALASPAGAVGAIAGGLLAAANHAADTAIAADNLARLTGDSVEQASQLAAVWESTGAEVTDLQDVLLQMQGTLADNEDIAERLGINLADGASGGARFQQVLDALEQIPDATERSMLAAKLFGEEGVRQVNALTGQYEDLGAAMDDVKALSAEDAEQARKTKAEIAALTREFQNLVTTIGMSVLPVLGQLVSGLDAVFTGAEELGRGFRDFFDAAADANHEITDAFKASEEAAADFDTTLLDGLYTFDKVRAKVFELTGDYHAANVVALEWLETTKGIGDETGRIPGFGHAPAAGIAGIAETNADRRAVALANARGGGTTNVFLPQSSPAVVHDKGEHWIQLNTMRTGP